MTTRVQALIDHKPTADEIAYYHQVIAEEQEKLLADTEVKWAIEDELEREFWENAVVSIAVDKYSNLSPQGNNVKGDV